MAKPTAKVYLGYEEEVIGDKNQSQTDYTVNKIGGFPDWPYKENIQFSSKCPLCGLHRLLIVQCYAPLEKSIFHRTLYVFACINPNCWNQSESWLCLRSQVQDNSANESSAVVAVPTPDSNLTWCNGADEWDENDNGDTANGNIMMVDNAPSPINGMLRNSDEDEESNSFEVESVEHALGNLQVFDAHNANMSPVQGAKGAIGVPTAAAELEGGDEPGLVTIDTPTAINNDLQALLHQTAELGADIRQRLLCGPLQFVAKYLVVEEERRQAAARDLRVTELLNKYTRDNEAEGVAGGVGGGGGCGGPGEEEESYEESAPLHGDRLFHNFLSRLREFPEQILRYSREVPPVLGAPIGWAGTPESPQGPHACARCGSPLICELQLVPHFADALLLSPGNNRLSHLHFLSVLVFTCSQSCWEPSDTLVKETVVFQPEL